ncbi:MAG: acyl-[ACP]--phospholipid O-acyltransferase [Verrucomicrobiaceae bacterium]|nr:acyl-[ACP]--phospholipid O-acyltransferase [Verrucomicrobiaceae bacterium]
MEPLRKLRGISPYLMAMFLNAFVDLGHKIIIQNTIFKIYDGSEQVVLTAIVNALILLPFILLFSPAGFISDRFPKNKVMRNSAWVAVVITSLITVCYYQGWFWGAFALTLALGAQAAIYSPAKYGYLKPLVGKERLAEGNGAVQAVTIVAILAGTFVYSIFFERRYDLLGAYSEAEILRAIAPLGSLLILNSVLELVLTYRLPQIEQGDTQLRFMFSDYLRGRALRDNLQPLKNSAVIRLSIIGLAVFWAVSQVMLAAFPAFAKDSLGIHNTVLLQGILAASGLGIILGSIIAGKWSTRHIETGLIPVGALGITLGLLWLPALHSVTAHCINFFFIGVMGGLFIVPLNALIQFHAGEHEMGKVLSANNLVQNIAMLAFLIVTALAAVMGVSTTVLLLMIAIVALIGTGYTVIKLPQSFVRFIVAYLLTRRYRVRVQGFKNIPESGGVLLLGNHISWIDWAIIQIASPRAVRFVMLKSIYERWYLRGFFRLFGVIPISQGAGAQGSLEQIAQLLKDGEVVCLFPEGTISRTGHLAEFRPGYERSCALVDDNVVIVPFYLRGLWGSQFSRSSARLKQWSRGGLQRDLIVAFGPAIPKSTEVDVLKRRVFDLSIRSWEQYVAELPTLAQTWLEAAKKVGNNLAIADSLADPLSGTQTIAAAFAFAKRIRRLSVEQNVGLLLPTSSAGALTNMAVLCAGKTIINLNYTASADAIKHALLLAEIKTVYTSRRFLEKLQQRGTAVGACLADVKLIYLEDLRAQIGKSELIARWLAAQLLPAFVLKKLFLTKTSPDSVAAILFSSGSEGLPKGVMLSHRNILANVRQIADVLNLEERDVVMATLPLFHAFGLTATTFMPLLEGAPMVCHADPTDALGVAKTIAEYRATVLCGTATFLRLYTKHPRVHPLMLSSLRIVVAGAEKLNDDVRTAFKLKFNRDVFEGYGATETTPVASVNLPDQLDTNHWQVQVGGKPGTVGMPLPGSSCKIVDPHTFEELPTGSDGLILVGGSQVMLGYLHDEERTNTVIVELDGLRWYKTGDKGHLDADGFLSIVDRYSRFAKIAGEMISLSAVEEKLRGVLAQPELELVAVSLPDEKKGEKIVALIATELEGQDMRKQLLAAQINPLMIPAEIYLVAEVPKLGSGKTDFAASRKLALEFG